MKNDAPRVTNDEGAEYLGRNLHYAGGCTMPVRRWAEGATLWVRCRKCESCLHFKRRLWAGRAITQAEMTPGRIWFCTYTLTPEAHNRLAAVKGTGASRYDRELAALRREWSLYMKRVRRRAQLVHRRMVRRTQGETPRLEECVVPLKFMVVAEAHKSGLPHLHALMFETSSTHRVSKAVLSSAWKLGFSKVRLALNNRKTIMYVAKYIAKDDAQWVRASIEFGRAKQPDEDEKVRKALSGPRRAVSFGSDLAKFKADIFLNPVTANSETRNLSATA